MALVFPLSRADFLDRLRARDAELFLQSRLQSTGLEGGEVLRAEVGPMLWAGRVELAPMKVADAAEIEALLEALQVPGRAFDAGHPHRLGPKSDPTGAGLDGFAPYVNWKDESLSAIRLAGLPVNYLISPGDLISFIYDGGARQALHRCVNGEDAGAQGQTTNIELTPHLRPGLDLATPVQLIRPYCRAVLVPGSVRLGASRAGRVEGIGFEFRQTLVSGV